MSASMAPLHLLRCLRVRINVQHSVLTKNDICRRNVFHNADDSGIYHGGGEKQERCEHAERARHGEHEYGDGSTPEP